tara:strand:+ start:558 stop:827 length:270 start_codon:yes stop_codon:yes gene_type:complete
MSSEKRKLNPLARPSPRKPEFKPQPRPFHKPDKNTEHKKKNDIMGVKLYESKNGGKKTKKRKVKGGSPTKRKVDEKTFASTSSSPKLVR